MSRPNPLVELTLSRFRLFLREPSAVFWTFGFPILLTIALGIAFRNRPPEPVDAVIEAGPGADRLRDQLLAAPRGDGGVRPIVLPHDEALRALRNGRAAILIAPGAPRRYIFDPSRPESRLARAVVDDALQRSDGRLDAATVADQRVSEPGSRYVDFLVPGLIGMNLMSSGLWGIGYVVVEMRTRKLLKRMVATPMKRGHFLLSFLLMRTVFVLAELPVLLGFAALAFRVPVRGSVVTLIGFAILGATSFAGLGLLLASRAQNTESANGLINLAMLPMTMCSGVFFSASHFPDAVQPFLRLLPLTALNDGMRAVMLEGAGVRQIAAPTAVLLAWSAVCFTLALRWFRWR